MTNLNITHMRLHNQHLAGTPLANPHEVVQWLGAVQAQDYGGAKWGVAQRSTSITDADLDQALADAKILRTHILRPTWHFVAPSDIRWMLQLTAPRINAFSAYYYRQLELDEELFARSNLIFEKALEGGKQLTREELSVALAQNGIDTANALRLSHIVFRAELDAVLVSGGRRGKQFTYGLLEERVAPAKPLTHDEALAELARRYFISHGPAALKDYVWWSGLTVSDAKTGLEMVKSELQSEEVNGETYWFASSNISDESDAMVAYLLPNFDEYTVAYKDRSAIYSGQFANSLNEGEMSLLNNVMVKDGQAMGFWKRTFKKDSVIIQLMPFTSLTDIENQAIEAAARRYGEFLGMRVVLQQPVSK